MRTFLALPTTLLLYLTTAHAQHDFDCRPQEAERDDTDGWNDEDAQQSFAWPSLAGVRKMSDDEGEKFFLHYWHFRGDTTGREGEPGNMSVASAPMAQYTNHDRAFALFGRSFFAAREYQCPADTNSCSSIGSDLCCPSSQTCVSTSGGVGCCASGDNCDVVGDCDMGAGYTSCDGGGCCVPGSVCENGSGCVVFGTSTVVVSAPTTVTSQATSTSEPPSSSTPTTMEVYTTTVTVTQSISGQMTTITSPTTIIIGISNSESQTASAPVRPTSVSSSTTSSTSSSSSSDTPVSQAAAPTSTSMITSTASDPASCPTGFYMCSAYYQGGCCRVGRDCDTASCPSSPSTTINSSGATVVVPATATTTAGGSCANGWFLCGSDEGGGCCPSGHACGSTSCSATISGEADTGKVAASSGGSSAVRDFVRAFGMGVALLAGVGMIVL